MDRQTQQEATMLACDYARKLQLALEKYERAPSTRKLNKVEAILAEPYARQKLYILRWFPEAWSLVQKAIFHTKCKLYRTPM